MRAGATRRLLLPLACMAVLATTIVVRTQAVAASPQQWGATEEQAFVQKINDLRASKGLPSLGVDPSLTAQARSWSQTMMDAGEIFHASDLSVGISADWAKLGENVGVGGTVDSLFDAFVASPAHYENLVDPLYEFIGIGVIWDGTRMFTAHRFMSVAAPAAPAPPPPAPEAPAPIPAVAEDPQPTPTPAPVPIPAPAPAAPTPEESGEPDTPIAERRAVATVIHSLMEGLE